MKYYTKFIFFFVLQFFAIQLLAQVSYDVRVVQTVNGSFLDMDIEIQSTGDPFVLSTSSFFLSYPTSPERYSTPEKIDANDGPWDSQTDPDYTNVLLSSGTGYIGLTVEFQGGDDENGTIVPNAWTRVGTMRLTITDASQSSELSWRAIGIVTQVSKLTDPGVAGAGSTDITDLGTFINPTNTPLPVELQSFKATNQKGSSVELEWATATEVNNYGFEIERKVVKAAEENEEAGTWEKVAFVEGSGNSNSQKIYNFVDKNPVGGTTFAYRLKQIDIDGTFEYSDEIEVKVLPSKYDLYQNYPNPFNPTTKIKFSLPENAKVKIAVYDILGRELTTLINKNIEAGYHSINFDATQFTSGVYLYTIETSKFTKVKKMLLLK